MVARIISTTALFGRFFGELYRPNGWITLFPMSVGSIAIDMETAYCAFEWIDHSITVSIKFQEMVRKKFLRPRVEYASRSTILSGIVPLRLFK